MSHTTLRSMVRCTLFTALLCLCSWIFIPMPTINLTMQTLGIFLTLGLLGGKWGTAACLTWLLLGAVGLPVFAGFQGGLGVLLGATGGYLWGFLIASLIYWAVTALLGDRSKFPAMVLGLLCCYGCGTLWYSFAYLVGTGSILPALVQCVLPYIFPDAIKLLLAHRLTQRLMRFVR